MIICFTHSLVEDMWWFKLGEKVKCLSNVILGYFMLLDSGII